MAFSGLWKRAIRDSFEASFRAGFFGSPAPRHRARLDVENIRACADVGERHRVRAGNPDLRAERGEFVAQRRAAVRIEMGDDFIEQQSRRDAGHLGHKRGVSQHKADQ